MLDVNKTKEKILNAAEQIFAEMGFDGTSVRAITQKANVNVSLVNYHFRDKDTLFKKIVNRRAQQIYKEIRAEIENFKKSIKPDNAGNVLRTKDLLTIILKTVMKPDEHDQTRRCFVWYVSGDLSAHHFFTSKTCLSGSSILLSFLYKEFRQTLQHLPEDTVVWRFQFMLGALEKILNPVPLVVDESMELYHFKTERAIKELSELIEMA